MAAIVGQNFGANKYNRITGTFARAWLISTLFMLFWTIVCQTFPGYIIGIFSSDSDVIRFGVSYLRVFSLGFVIVGAIMVFSAVFQGLGKTYPSLIGAVVDNAFFAGLVFTLPVYFSWGIQSMWWIKLITAIIETAVVAVWLERELQRTRMRIQRVLQKAG
jgi:Na+-driven multidrug efflux pump